MVTLAGHRLQEACWFVPINLACTRAQVPALIQHTHDSNLSAGIRIDDFWNMRGVIGQIAKLEEALPHCLIRPTTMLRYMRFNGSGEWLAIRHIRMRERTLHRS